MRDPRATARWRLLLALGATAITGCTMIADVSDYEFCRRGSLRCGCYTGDVCDQGLECRPPGVCIDPSSGRDVGQAGE